jgi:uncharacterized protein YndB with AHSA1/START domain
MNELPYHLNRTILIKAYPETVFRFFTDSARWASWWGAGSTIEARPGGRVYIRHANGIESMGEVLEVIAPDRISFTYGFASGQPVPPGGSRVTIRLEPVEDGTRLHLLHEFEEASPRDEHIQGWRFQLSLFSNAVCNDTYANAQGIVDAWFDVWANKDEQARDTTLARIAVPGVGFHDRYSALDGLADLTAHISASQLFMPGIGLRRNGNIRQCQGTVLADWIAAGADGIARMTGTSVFVFRTDGRLESVTSFADPPRA